MLQRVSHNFWQTGSEVCLEIPKLTTNLAIWSRSYQSCYKLCHQVGNYVANQPVHIKASTKVADIRTSWLHVFEGSHAGSESSSRILCWFTEGWNTFTNENQRTKEGSTWKWNFDSRRLSLRCSTSLQTCGHRCSVGICNRSVPLSIFI